MIRLKDRNSPGLIPGMPEAKSTGHKGLISSSSNSESTDSAVDTCAEQRQEKWYSRAQNKPQTKTL